MVTYKTVIKRYCPSREHNVEIEIARHDDGQLIETCMQECCNENKCKICNREKGRYC